MSRHISDVDEQAQRKLTNTWPFHEDVKLIAIQRFGVKVSDIVARELSIGVRSFERRTKFDRWSKDTGLSSYVPGQHPKNMWHLCFAHL